MQYAGKHHSQEQTCPKPSSRLVLFFGLYLVFIAVSAATRTVLLCKSFAEIECSLTALGMIYSAGFLYDTLTFCYGCIPAAAYLALIPEKLFRLKPQQYVVYTLGFLFILAIVFNAFAEYFFWDEFGVRYNFIAVDYLIYTREVLGNLWQSYPLAIILPAILIIAVGLFAATRRYLDITAIVPGTWRMRLAHGSVFLLVPALCSGLLDPSLPNISANSHNCNLAGNGIYMLWAAFRQNNLDYSSFYATRDSAAAIKDLRALVRTDNTVYPDSADARPGISRLITRRQEPEKQCNVIVLMLESMSAEYLGVFGNPEGLTPNLDALARDGILFENMYATGTRTVRGMEAVCLSVPPVPGTSIVRMPHNENLFTIANVFRDRAYDSLFIYGGYGYFDNMNSFFRNNGFSVIDRTDFSKEEISFENIWGICDENLMDRVLREADKRSAAGRSFFMFVMTTSNHRPFTFPAGTVSVPRNTPHAQRKSGVKYADYAVGTFINRAAGMPWFDNTIFVIVADHCASSAGRTGLPPENYRIPCIIYAPKLLSARRIPAMASQIDIAPTIFDILGWEYTSSFFGKSILSMRRSEERAFLSNYLDLGYLQDGRLVVLEPKKEIATYLVDRGTHEIQPTENNEDFVNAAISYFQVASLLGRQANHVPQPVTAAISNAAHNAAWAGTLDESCR